MKKLVLTMAIVLTMGMGAFAQDGLLGRGAKAGDEDLTTPVLPLTHGETTDQNGDAPLGSGIALMLGLGAAYLVGKKRNED